MCAMVLLVFGWLLFVNYFVLISVWFIDTLFFLAITCKYYQRSKPQKVAVAEGTENIFLMPDNNS